MTMRNPRLNIHMGKPLSDYDIVRKKWLIGDTSIVCDAITQINDFVFPNDSPRIDQTSFIHPMFATSHGDACYKSQ